MLVFPDGSQRGTLGGGCVEAEVKQRALRVLAAQDARPEVLTFCLDDNYGWDDGLICGGRMTIVATPLTREAVACGGEARTYFAALRELVEAGAGCTEAVVIGERAGLAPAGTRYLFNADGQPAAQLCASVGNGRQSIGWVAPPLTVQLRPARERPRPWCHESVAYLPVPPRITLLIVGAGHVGQAVARLAAEVDFDVWVLDDREAFASRERFPTASRRLVGDIGATLKDLAPTFGYCMFCLIVTRGHAHDEEALYHLSGTAAAYVGMIGSRRKVKLIYEDLMARGVARELLSRVHAPLGLEIGSQTVPEIAVSIVAELIAFRNLGQSAAMAFK
jgi:xanthine dehydrogenase accessory factor